MGNAQPHLVAALLVISTAGSATAGKPKMCPPWGCLDVECNLQTGVTIPECNNAIYSYDEQIKMWRRAFDARKIEEPSYKHLTALLEADCANPVLVLQKLRQMAKATGHACFAGKPNHTVCVPITEPTRTPPSRVISKRAQQVFFSEEKNRNFFRMLSRTEQAAQIPKLVKVFCFFSSEKKTFRSRALKSPQALILTIT
jgi:hypothetical protein